MLNIVFLHGFLGTSRDFGLVESRLKSEKFSYRSWSPQFFKPGPCSAELSFKDWQEQFIMEIQKRFKSERVLLVGYSLGARMALHGFFMDPSRFELFLLAGNPGVGWSSNKKRTERLDWENYWTRAFLEKNLEDVLDEWNQQDLLRTSSPRLSPSCLEVDPKLLSHSISNWSVLKHEFTLDDLNQLPPQTQWWFGQRDLRYMEFKDELERLGIPGHYRVLEDVGHRIPLDAPELVARQIKTWSVSS